VRARRARIALLLGLVPGLLGFGALEWPLTAGLETRYGLDLLFKLRRTQPAPSGVVVVGIDDASYAELGLDPKAYWPRSRHADLVRTLVREGARAVAFDVLFDKPGDPAEDAQFELALFDAGNVVLGSTVELTEDPRFRQVQLVEPHAPFAESAAAVAEVAVVPDPDGVMRRAWLVPDDRPSLALAAYALATHDESARATESGPRLIDYYGPPRTIPTVSLYQALDPAQYLPPEFFRDKLVFVGANQVAARSFAESKDSFPTPFSGGAVGYTYGVEVHATLAANLLEGRHIEMLPEAAETLLLFALALAATLVFVWLEPRIGLVAFLAAELACLAAAYLAFTRTGTWIPLVIPAAIQLPTAYVSGLAWYYLTTAREREKIRRAFSFYLSPEMIRRIADNPDSLRLGGEEVQGTAVFTDIAGFTSIAEKMTAHDTASMLNDYFSAITGKIFETGGTLIKYIGDAVFAIWGAPLPLDDHATRACLTALDMGRQSSGDGAAGRLVTRVGVHTGSMLVGNLGSSQRFDYTAIGDTVNLAARLESLNKAWGTRILISGETLAATDGALVVRALGRVRVVGRAEPVALYELLGANGAATQPGATTLELFDRALAGFTARRFDEAAAGFREVLALCGGQDGPSAFYLATLERYRTDPPPPGWDGVIDFVTK
jgi:adenylate cyclase